MMCDLVLGVEVGHLLGGKVRFIVEDDGVGGARRGTLYSARGT